MFRHFICNVYPKLLNKILSVFDIDSGPIVGLWSLVLLIGCSYSIYTTKQVTMPVATIFSTIITGFAGHKIVKILKGSDQCAGQGEDNNVDTNGK